MGLSSQSQMQSGSMNLTQSQSQTLNQQSQSQLDVSLTHSMSVSTILPSPDDAKKIPSKSRVTFTGDGGQNVQNVQMFPNGTGPGHNISMDSAAPH